MIVRVVKKDERSHLVAIIHVPEEDDDIMYRDNPWVLFNDFTVCNLSEDQALTFVGNWKVSTKLCLTRY